MATTARSVMTDSVVSVDEKASLLQVLRLFVEENIHGAPVVDDDGHLLGVISTSDLLRAQQDEQDSVLATSDYLQGMLEFSAPDWTGSLGDFQDRLGARTVGEIMTKDFVSVTGTTPVADVARCLRENQIHRVWVVEDGCLVGVVSTLDLMQVIEQAG